MADTAGKRAPLKGGPFFSSRLFRCLRLAVFAGLAAGGFLLVQAQGVPAAAPHGGGLPTNIPWGLLALFVGLLVASALVSSSETALFSLDKLDINQMKNSGRWADRFIIRLLEQPNDTLVTILILNNFFNIASSLTAGAFTEQLFNQMSALTFTVAALLAASGLLLVGDILPKVLAHINPQRAARLLAPPMVLASVALLPMRVGIGWFLRVVFRLLNIPETSAGEEVSEEELKVMISSGEVSQVLEKDEREMIDGVFELRRTVAAEILTPRMSVSAVPDDLEQEEMVERLRKLSNSRVLVYHESQDNLLGFLLVKEVLLDKAGNWRNHLREPMLAPEGIGLLDLLRRFRKERTKMAVIVDEYGGVAGIVTLQDILQEIVGDIYEKHEHNEMDIQELAEGHWRVAGTYSLASLGEVTGVDFPENRGRTVAGFVMNTLGRIPEIGDEVVHENLVLQVERMVARRLQSLVVWRLVGAEDTEGAREVQS